MPPVSLFDDSAIEHRWRARIRAPQWSVPTTARSCPNRSVYRSSANGTAEIYLWDRDTNTHRQVTNRANGTLDGLISADGNDVWWFSDTDGDEFGHWMSEPADAAHSARKAFNSLPDGYNCGLALSMTVAVIGLATSAGTTLWISREGQQPEVLYEHSEDVLVRTLSNDDSLVAINHGEHGDNRNPGVRVLHTADGTTAASLLDPGRRMIPLGFSPIPGDSRLLLSHERRGRMELLLWDPLTDDESAVSLPLPGDVEGRWYPDGTSLLLIHTHVGRSSLHRFDLQTETLTDLRTPTGCIEAAEVRPDGAVEYLWSSSARPWAVRCVQPTGRDVQLLPDRAAPTPGSVAMNDAWVDGPAGSIHIFISTPENGQAPFPTVYRLHGGPHQADEDSFSAMRSAWIDAGFAVVQVNYRGSSGYGAEWRNSITGRPGLTELEDVVAAQHWCIARGVSRRDQCIVEGYSWGGMLALLAAGLHPGDWAAAIAGLPVCDCVSAYADEMPSLQAMDRALFGGAPDEAPEAYKRASPLSYVESVRAPVLLLAGRNDPRCPIGQIEAYARALEQVGGRATLLRYEIGHGPHVSELVEAFVLAGVSFAREALAP